MAILVTGGAGFVGAHVVRRLIDEGESVVVYDIAPNLRPLSRVCGDDVAGRIPIVQGEVTDLARLVETAQRYEVESIVHLAALLPPACRANPRAGVAVNVEGLLNVLDVARFEHLRRVVWASSVALFGEKTSHRTLPVLDDSPHSPCDLYGASKSFGESLAKVYRDQYGVDNIALRFGGVYGLGKERGLVEQVALRPALGLPARVPQGDDSFDWLYVADAARAADLALRAGRHERLAYNIVGQYRPVAEGVAFVRKLLPEADISIVHELGPYVFHVDGAKAKEELGYEAEWSMEQGLAATINMIRAERGLPEVKAWR